MDRFTSVKEPCAAQSPSSSLMGSGPSGGTFNHKCHRYRSRSRLRGAGRPKHFLTPGTDLWPQEPRPKVGRPLHLCLAFTLKQQANQTAKGRVMKGFAKRQLPSVEGFIVVLSCLQHCIVLRIVRLDDDNATVWSSSRPSSRLDKQLKGAFTTAIIRQIENGIRRHHADQGYSWEVESFGHHLGAHQDIELSGGKRTQNLSMGSLRLVTSASKRPPGSGNSSCKASTTLASLHRNAG